MGALIKDIRYGIRGLLNRPGFSVASTASLALGIGACAAIFSIVDGVLLRSLPYAHADRLVAMKEVNAKGRRSNFGEPNFEDVRARNHSFEMIAEYSGAGIKNMVGGSEPVTARVSVVSADFFRVLEINPAVGRFFLPEEIKTGAPVAVLSYAFWQQSFGGKTDLAGTTLRLDNQSFSVVGVMPPDLIVPEMSDVWLPRELFPPETGRTSHNWRIIARLRPEVQLNLARSDLSAIARQLKSENGEGTTAVDFAIVPLQEFLVGNTRSALLVIFGAVGFLLLVASTNVGNLLLAQMTVRRKEFAVRSALGAGRWRLAQQFLIENLLLALLGGAGGVLLSFLAVALILKLNQGSLPRADEISVNARALIFTISLSALVAAGLGIVSVLHFAGSGLPDELKEAARGQTAHGAGTRLRAMFVVAQVTLTLILLVGAGLLGKSFVELMRVDPGFRSESAVAMNLSLPTSGKSQVAPEPARTSLYSFFATSDDKDQQKRNALFYQQLLERLEQVPGVIAVGGIEALPLTGSGADGNFLIDNNPARAGNAEYRRASSGYFNAMAIPLRRGRYFDSTDSANTPPVAVISQALAEKYFPGTDPIGRTLQFRSIDGDGRLLEIVGVVGNVHEGALDDVPALTVYANAAQRPQSSSLTMVVRAQSDAAVLIPSMRQAVQSLNRDLPVKFRTLSDVYSSSFDARRFSLVIFGVLAAVTLILATLGLYSVVSYTVAQRTREIGIRRALGAQGSDVLKLVLRRGLALTLYGVCFGLVGSFALTRLMKSLLFGVTAHDPVTLGSVTVLLVMVALVACLVPARRATKVDPLVALRNE